MSTEAARDAVAAQSFWYHTIEVVPGIETPGMFDLRPIVDRLPWPDVRGKRCLDVGTWDGFLAFELERRGADAVVAVDIADHTQWDWNAATWARGPQTLARLAGPKAGEGFRVARELLGSSVERVETSVYDLTPERLGSFDVVACGSLMLHLRDPVRALEAIRGVCREWFLSAETIRPDLTARFRRRPLADFRGGERGQWWLPNVAGHRRMVEAAGFEIARCAGPYAIPRGRGNPRQEADKRPGGWLRARLGSDQVGVPHAAVLAKPAL